MPLETAGQFARCIEDVTRSGQTGLLEYSLPILGEERHYEARVVHCGDKVLSLVRDITEHKQVEQALRRSEEQARRTLVEQMLVGVAECDAAGKFLLVNRRFCDITGYTEAELLEMRRHDLTHPGDVLRITELHRRLVEAGESFVTEIRYRRKDGPEVWVNSNVSPVHDARNEAVGSVTVVIDVTDRKRAEREREQLLEKERAARAEAEAANRSKDEFLAIVSHELRNPLNAILGYTQLLRLGRVDPLEIRSTAEILERNGRIQLQLIEDLLDSARIISGKLELEVQPVSLSRVITAALDAIRPAAQAKGIELRSDLEPLAGQILGDPERLQQVVWNLLSNAIKFTPQSGRVELRMENAGQHVRVTVKDTGKGIESEFLPFCFDRFRQSDSSSTRRFGGLGLGLSLVKQLLELHGGTIEATSDGLGRGATFTVTLPQHGAQADAFVPQRQRALPERKMRMAGATPFDEVPSLEGVRVLVVDDEEDARTLLKTVLGKSGAQVMTVSSGVEVLAILAGPQGAAQPDVLILDINMPAEDGYRVLERVRALEAERGVAPSARIPAIALTAMGGTEERLKALAAGFRMHIVKPVEPGELIVVIANLVKRFSVRRIV
jgi:PAS domain S-box-containing protein